MIAPRDRARLLTMIQRALFLTLAAALLLAVPPASPAAVPQAPDCTLLSHGDRREYPIPGTQLVAVDPYAGVYSRSQGYSFSVSGPAEARAAVARVEWRMDGVLVR